MFFGDFVANVDYNAVTWSEMQFSRHIGQRWFSFLFFIFKVDNQI